MPTFPNYILAYDISSSTKYIRWEPVYFPEIIPPPKDITSAVWTFFFSLTWSQEFWDRQTLSLFHTEEKSEACED